jgi:TetR/AcrR family fatty acid metabolism transcriptional regulator
VSVVCACIKKYQRGKREDRRNHILDSAFTVFIKKGIHSAKMEDIAHEAGYGKSTLYEYFGSKDEIFSELIRVKFIDRYGLIAEQAGREPTPEGKLRAFIVAEMDMFEEYGGKESMEGFLMSDLESALASEFLQSLHNIVMFKFERISGYIAEGIRDGSFRETDIYIAAALVIGSAMTYHGTVTSPVYQMAIAAKGGPDRSSIDTYFDLIFRALRK